MRKQLCSWMRPQCKTTIEVDEKFDIPGLALAGGFCKFHDEVYHVEHELFEKLAEKVEGKDAIDLKNDMWKRNRKGYDKIFRRAFRIVESVIVVA